VSPAGASPARAPSDGTSSDGTSSDGISSGGAAPLLEVAGLHVAFGGGVRAVRGMDFTVAPGEVLALVGESGAGKSATALAVMGLLPVAARVHGSVRFRGRELLGLHDRELASVRGKDIAMVFQDQAFTPVYRIGAQIAEAVRTAARVPRRTAAARAVELLGLAGVSDAARVAQAFPHELSGGLGRRAMVAMAMAGEPSVILADEPTAGLDAPVQAQVLDAFQTLRSRTGAALVLITHDLGVVAGHADRVLVMYAGRPVETGPVNEIFSNPRMPYTIALLSSAPHLDRPHAPAGRPGHRARLHAPEIGRSEPLGLPASEGAAGSRRAGAAVLEVDGLVRHFPPVADPFSRRPRGTVRAVDGIGFDLRAGETLGLVGESGCGKTTTLLEILRLAACQAGSVSVFGRDTARLSARQRRELRRDLQVVFQDPAAALDPRMTVGAIVAEPLRAFRHARRDIAVRVPELLRLVGLEPAHVSRRPGELSGGQRQRVGIARALALGPKLLVMDEPFSALDVTVQAGIIGLLHDLRKHLGLSYLIAAHDLAALRQLADRVAVMRLGRIVEIGAAGAVYETPAHPYTRALLAAVPVPDPRRERARRRVVLGDPGPAPSSGCRFRARCPTFTTLAPDDGRRCVEEAPGVRQFGPDQAVACHFPVRGGLR
jgi:peptide/nickel transport system ATP-binding protein